MQVSRRVHSWIIFITALTLGLVVLTALFDDELEEHYGTGPWHGLANAMPWVDSSTATQSVASSSTGQRTPIPLPAGAAQTITAPHGYRGKCHNCHPYSTAGSAAGSAASAQTVARSVGSCYTNGALVVGGLGGGMGQGRFGTTSRAGTAPIGTPPPLPAGAMRTLTPTHPSWGRCHNCHPYAAQ